MSKKVDKKYNAESDYPYFYYDPEGDGFVYFKTEKMRNEWANDAIQQYLDEGWDEQVTNVVCGKVTGQATMVDVKTRDGEVNEDDVDESGESWLSEWDYKCNYTLKPLDFVCPSTKQLETL